MLIGWGQNPVVSEYSPHGRELFSARLTAGNMSYREFRGRWTGLPERGAKRRCEHRRQDDQDLLELERRDGGGALGSPGR